MKFDRFEFHKAICISLNDLYYAKNTDYGDSFGESIRKYGKIAALTRMSDKFSRIEKLMLGHEVLVHDEPLIDSLIDLANYAIMTIVEIKREEADSYYYSSKEEQGEA